MEKFYIHKYGYVPGVGKLHVDEIKQNGHQAICPKCCRPAPVQEPYTRFWQGIECAFPRHVTYCNCGCLRDKPLPQIYMDIDEFARKILSDYKFHIFCCKCSKKVPLQVNPNHDTKLTMNRRFNHIGIDIGTWDKLLYITINLPPGEDVIERNDSFKNYRTHVSIDYGAWKDNTDILVKHDSIKCCFECCCEFLE
jgi:hypothetical protein